MNNWRRFGGMVCILWGVLVMHASEKWFAWAACLAVNGALVWVDGLVEAVQIHIMLAELSTEMLAAVREKVRLDMEQETRRGE